MDDILTIYGEDERTQDEYGRWHIKKTERTVFCRHTRVSMQEFYDAGRNGFIPEYRFLVFSGDYHDETTVGFHGMNYSVYRTYMTGDTVELYVRREGGTNGSQ